MRHILVFTFLCGWPSLVACHGTEQSADGHGQAAGSAHACSEHPTAWSFPSSDDAAHETLTLRLEAAGFAVQALPIDVSPWGLAGMIVLPSFAAEDPAYADYMGKYASDLYAFVDEANVLVQLAQSTEAETQPPFLPTTHRAVRSEAAVQDIRAVSESPLLAGVELTDGHPSWPTDLAADPFSEQGGFQVVLATDPEAQQPLLMEGAYGQGRIALSSLALDVSAGDAQADAFAERFFTNLATYTTAVCQRKTSAIAVTGGPQPIPFTKGSVTFGVLPDTQVYSLRVPGLFDMQTEWLVREAARLNMAYVFHLGDIVNNNTPLEWERAAASMRTLHGHLPYAIVPGNHDYGPSGDASTRDTLFNDYFDFAAHAKQPGFAGAYEQGKLDNTYHLFSAGGYDWIVLALEWGPRDEVIAWANARMDENPDRLGILVTHAYLNNNNRRYDHTDDDHPQAFNPHEYDTPGVNDGEELWQELVRHHAFVMTLNGHVLGDGAGYLATRTDVGTMCHQILSNYQMRDLGGEGYLRLLELLPDGRTVIVRSYSPLYDCYMLSSEHQFTFTLELP